MGDDFRAVGAGMVEGSVEAYGVAAAFGLVIGSFLNVVIYRLPIEGLSLVRPGSFCPACRTPVRWRDNVPVLSYLLLGGKCRSCRKPIPLRYPLIELLTGLLFVATLYWSLGTGWDVICVRLVFVAALLAVTFIDFDHFIIPDAITVPGMVLTPILSFLIPSLHRGSFLARNAPESIPTAESALIASLLGIAAGAASVYLVGLGGKLLFRKDAMGLGDVKLMGAAGGLLGAEGVIAAFFLGAVFGALFGLGNVLRLGIGRASRLLRRGWGGARSLAAGLRLGRRLGSYIPFGPFLSLGCACVLFFREEIFSLALDSWPRWIRGLFGIVSS